VPWRRTQHELRNPFEKSSEKSTLGVAGERPGTTARAVELGEGAGAGVVRADAIGAPGTSGVVAIVGELAAGALDAAGLLEGALPWQPVEKK
jgi:hypothetical protein